MTEKIISYIKVIIILGLFKAESTVTFWKYMRGDLYRIIQIFTVAGMLW